MKSHTARVMELLGEAKKIAKEYYSLTGKPLGITGEVAEYEVARILRVELTAARQDGYDAIERRNNSIRHLQIKSRCLQPNCKASQRIGSINVKKDWDAVLLVLLDADFETKEIYEAERAAIVKALSAPGSKARNERGQLGVSKFKAIGKRRWERKATNVSEEKDYEEPTLPRTRL